MKETQVGKPHRKTIQCQNGNLIKELQYLQYQEEIYQISQ